MPIYDITVEQDGQIYDLVIEGDREPTDAEVMAALGQQAQPASPGVGELRRREGAGEVAASLTPTVDAVTGGPSLLDRALAPLRATAEGFSNMEVGPMAERFLSAMGETGDISGVSAPPVSAAGTPERAAEIQGYKEGFARVAPMIAGAQVGSMIPTAAGMVAGPLSVAGQGLLGAAAEQFITQTPEVVSGKPVTSAIVDAAVPVATATVAGPLLMGAGKLALASGQALGKAGGFTKNLVANLNRPVELTAEQLRSLRSRDLIETSTGQRIPLGLAEALNMKTISGNLRSLTDELSPESLSTIEQAALHVVSNTTRSGRSSQELSPLVYDILDTQKTGLNEQAKEAANAFVRKYIGAVNKAEEQVTGAAKSIFRGREFKVLGKEGEKLAEDSLKESQAAWNAKYDAFKSLPVYNEVKVDLSSVNDAAEQAGLSFVRDATGKLSVIGAPPGARSSIAAGTRLPKASAADPEMAELRKMMNIPEEDSGAVPLEQARQLVTQLGKDAYKAGYLPGVDIRVKLDLLNAAKDAIDSAVAPFPELQQGIGEASKFYSENIKRFRSVIGEGLMAEIGQGGATPEAVVGKLIGPSASTYLDDFENLLGAGTPRAAQGLNLIREAVLTKAASSMAGGKVNVGQMFATVNVMPDSVKAKLFPGFEATVKPLIEREAALATSSTVRQARKFLDEVEIDATAFQKAFEGDTKPLIEAAKAAAKQEAGIAATLNKLGLDELKDRSAFELNKWMASPGNQSRIRNTLDQLEKKNPELVRDAKSLFIDSIMKKASPGDVFDPVLFGKLIGDTTLPTGPGAPGVAPGEYSDAVESVFGPKIKKELQDVAASLTDVPRPGDVKVADKNILHYLVFGYSGGPLASSTPNTIMNAVGRLTTVPEILRYKIASHFLTDDNLRRTAMQPLNANTLKALDKAVRAATVSIGQQFGKRSELYKEAQDLDAAIQPGAARYTAPQYTPPTPTVQPAPEPVQQPPQEVEIGIPNQYGRTVTKKLTRDSARKALEEQRALLQKYRQQLQ